MLVGTNLGKIEISNPLSDYYTRKYFEAVEWGKPIYEQQSALFTADVVRQKHDIFTGISADAIAIPYAG